MQPALGGLRAKIEGDMTRFALIDLNSGFVWHACNAESAAQACVMAVAETGGTVCNDGESYREIVRSDIHSSAGGFAVHIAPDGYVCEDGQDIEQIEAVVAMPLAGYYRSA
jgi:hypothetical protein